MSRLSAYILRQCTTAGLSLFVTAAFLVWITQTLRLFDLITAKGQDLLTLMGQAAMTTPPLSGAILYICMGIGLARTLRGMQDTRELHSIHAGRRLPGLFAAIIWFALGGAVAVGLIVHWAEPISKRLYREWQADVAADLVGRTLTPHRFTEAAPGLVVFISRPQPGRVSYRLFRRGFPQSRSAPDLHGRQGGDRDQCGRLFPRYGPGHAPISAQWRGFLGGQVFQLSACARQAHRAGEPLRQHR